MGVEEIKRFADDVTVVVSLRIDAGAIDALIRPRRVDFALHSKDKRSPDNVEALRLRSLQEGTNVPIEQGRATRKKHIPVARHFLNRTLE